MNNAKEPETAAVKRSSALFFLWTIKVRILIYQ